MGGWCVNLYDPQLFRLARPENANNKYTSKTQNTGLSELKPPIKKSCMVQNIMNRTNLLKK